MAKNQSKSDPYVNLAKKFFDVGGEFEASIRTIRYGRDYNLPRLNRVTYIRNHTFTSCCTVIGSPARLNSCNFVLPDNAENLCDSRFFDLYLTERAALYNCRGIKTPETATEILYSQKPHPIWVLSKARGLKLLAINNCPEIVIKTNVNVLDVVNSCVRIQYRHRPDLEKYRVGYKIDLLSATGSSIKLNGPAQFKHIELSRSYLHTTAAYLDEYKPDISCRYRSVIYLHDLPTDNEYELKNLLNDFRARHSEWLKSGTIVFAAKGSECDV